MCCVRPTAYERGARMGFAETLWEKLWSEYDPDDPTSIIVKVIVVGAAFIIALALFKAAAG